MQSNEEKANELLSKLTPATREKFESAFDRHDLAAVSGQVFGLGDAAGMETLEPFLIAQIIALIFSEDHPEMPFDQAKALVLAGMLFGWWLTKENK